MASFMSLPAPGLKPIDLTSAKAAAPLTPAEAKSAKAKKAAQNFEQVFLHTMFEQMSAGVEGDGPFGGSGATGVWRSMLTDAYAKSVSKAGGIGIAAQVYKSLMAAQEAHR